MTPQLRVGLKPAAEHFQPVKIDQALPYQKPQGGGLWTSTFTPDAPYQSAWLDWCASEMPDWGQGEAWVLTPDPAATVFVIDSAADLDNLIDLYPHISTHHYASNHVNWEAVGSDFDGVQLTDEGQWATRLDNSPWHGADLYGWDCESTLWFKWRFTSVKALEMAE